MCHDRMRFTTQEETSWKKWNQNEEICHRNDERYDQLWDRYRIVRLHWTTRKDTAYDFDRANFLEKFWFRSPEDIDSLIHGLQIPAIVITHGVSSLTHEIVSASFCRLAYPLRWSDIMAKFSGLSRTQCICAFYWFVDFMVENWGYLILHYREFWKPYLMSLAQAIKDKMEIFVYRDTQEIQRTL